MMSMFMNAVLVFVDPVTKAKIQINPSTDIFPKIVPADQLLKDYGGDVVVGEWKGVGGGGFHDDYWKELAEVTRGRRERRRRIWKEKGGGVGQSEEEWKGPDLEKPAPAEPEEVVAKVEESEVKA